jgi:hypothetical protein
MKKIALALVFAFCLVGVVGCGSGGSSPAKTETKKG